MRVEELMKSPQCCREADSVRDCAKLMKTENVGFAPICNQSGEPVGTITDRDIAIRVIAEGRSPDTKVQDVMTREVISCRVGEDLSEAERLMRDKHKSRIMVCDQSGKLAGVISLSDVVELEEERGAETLREVSSRETHQPHAS